MIDLGLQKAGLDREWRSPAKDLQALERLLFDAPRDAYTCAFAGAIAGYQSALADRILDDWTKEGGFRQAAFAAGAASDEYAVDAEVARDPARHLCWAPACTPPLASSAAGSRCRRIHRNRRRRADRTH